MDITQTLKNTSLTIVPLAQISYEDWLGLWQAYQTFYRVQLSTQISQYTWSRLCDVTQTHLYGFAAILDQEVVGIVHVIEHESCWTLKPYAYLQDLFVNENQRGKGIARTLIEQVHRDTQARQCDRVYWLTHHENAQAQKLYDQIAVKTGFIQYRI